MENYAFESALGFSADAFRGEFLFVTDDNDKNKRKKAFLSLLVLLDLERVHWLWIFRKKVCSVIFIVNTSSKASEFFFFKA